MSFANRQSWILFKFCDNRDFVHYIHRYAPDIQRSTWHIVDSQWMPGHEKEEGDKWTLADCEAKSWTWEGQAHHLNYGDSAHLLELGGLAGTVWHTDRESGVQQTLVACPILQCSQTVPLTERFHRQLKQACIIVVMGRVIKERCGDGRIQSCSNVIFLFSNGGRKIPECKPMSFQSPSFIENALPCLLVIYGP